MGIHIKGNYYILLHCKLTLKLAIIIQIQMQRTSEGLL